MKKKIDLLVYMLFILSTIIIGIGIALTSVIMVLSGLGITVLAIFILLKQIRNEEWKVANSER